MTTLDRIHVCTFVDARNGRIYRIEFGSARDADAWDENRLGAQQGTAYMHETAPHATDKEWSSMPRDYNPTRHQQR